MNTNEISTTVLLSNKEEIVTVTRGAAPAGPAIRMDAVLLVAVVLVLIFVGRAVYRGPGTPPRLRR